MRWPEIIFTVFKIFNKNFQKFRKIFLPKFGSCIFVEKYLLEFFGKYSHIFCKFSKIL